MYDSALEILKKLNTLGYETYIIGGYPRDTILNYHTDDIDICTNALPHIIKELFDVVKDNSKFGSLTINYNNYLYEITTYRIELEYNNRYPKIEFTNSLEDDLKRRDFTINTICIDKNGQYIDLLNGIDDLNNKLIRSIGNVDKKIKEDPIRILRAIRLKEKLNFNLDKELESSIIEYGYLLETLSVNTIKSELNKMNDKAINTLKQLKLDKYLKELI